MTVKSPIFHPYSTNTGQTLITQLVEYPRAAMWFKLTTPPAAPIQIELELEEVILLVHTQLDIIVGMDDTTLPTVPASELLLSDTIYFPANTQHLVQWPSQYFTPIPLDTAVTGSEYVFVNLLSAQNSTGDEWKLGNR